MREYGTRWLEATGSLRRARRARRRLAASRIALAGPPDGPANAAAHAQSRAPRRPEAFVEEAAWQLAAEVSGGAEIPFELIEQGRSTAPLYCYRPLTGTFLADRAGELAQAPEPSPPPARSCSRSAASTTTCTAAASAPSRPTRTPAPTPRCRRSSPPSGPTRRTSSSSRSASATPSRSSRTPSTQDVHAHAGARARRRPGHRVRAHRARRRPEPRPRRRAASTRPRSCAWTRWATVAAVRIEGGDEVLVAGRPPPAPPADRPAPVGRRRAAPSARAPGRAPAAARGCTSRSPPASAARSTTACSSRRRRTRCARSAR